MEFQGKQEELKEKTEPKLKEKTEFPIQNMADGEYSPLVNIAFGSMKDFMKNKENFKRKGKKV